MRKISFIDTILLLLSFILTIIILLIIIGKFDKFLPNKNQNKRIEIANQYVEYFKAQIEFQAGFGSMPFPLTREITNGTDTISFFDYFHNKETLVFVLSNSDCKTCAENILEKTLSIIDSANFSKDILILTTFGSFKDYLVFRQASKSKYPIYQFVNFDFLGLNKSFCFYITPSMSYSSPLLINISYPFILYHYLKSIILFY